jgi:UTP--glucose-1-phosphate uridylyltransferase
VSKPLRKVVFPVAGLGTRFLPATKVIAKEMLPVLDKPLIQYAVDEAVDAGADTLIFVTNRYKHAIADYFDKAYELEAKLHEKGKAELLTLVQGTLPRLAWVMPCCAPSPSSAMSRSAWCCPMT